MLIIMDCLVSILLDKPAQFIPLPVAGSTRLEPGTSPVWPVLRSGSVSGSGAVITCIPIHFGTGITLTRVTISQVAAGALIIRPFRVGSFITRLSPAGSLISRLFRAVSSIFPGTSLGSHDCNTCLLVFIRRAGVEDDKVVTIHLTGTFFNCFKCFAEELF